MLRSTRGSDRHGKRNLTRKSPRLETLEGRQMMSLGAEFVGPVNTTTRHDQFDSANASSSNGSSVVVWTDTFSAADHDIRAQRYSAAGEKVGPEILVAGSSNDDQTPAVAMDSQGNFVVAWRQTQPGGDTNVLARKFNSAGQPQGAVVGVGVGTFAETDPRVAMDARGDFVVSYTRDTNNNDPDIFAKLYDTNAQLLNVVSVAVTPRAATHSRVAMTPDGRFDVAWEEAFSAADHDIKLNQYSASGTLVNSRIMAASTLNETNPTLSMDNFGNAVVAWQRRDTADSDIQARRVSSTGVLGTLMTIAHTTTEEWNPSVALKQGGGGFVVSYNSTADNVTQVKVAEVSASGAVNTLSAGTRFGASVSINGADQYLLTYTSIDAGDLNIRRRLGHIA